MANLEIPVLVAGGAGYIGSHTAKALRRAGMLPVVVDNLATGNRWAVRFGPFAEGSIASRALIRETVREYGIRGAILFAAHAYVGESTQDPAKYYRNNVSGSIEFLDGLLESGVKTMVFSSSCSIYGIQKEIPIREDSSKDPFTPTRRPSCFWRTPCAGTIRPTGCARFACGISTPPGLIRRERSVNGTLRRRT